MPGETELKRLMSGMQPQLQPGEFVFCCVAEAPEGCEAWGILREVEGVTIICQRSEAERLRLPFTFVSRLITLTVHSSLEAVGLLAAVTAELAGRGIAVNAVSAYYHDHLFVPAERAEEALGALERLSGTRG